ncbi:MAG: N(G),N(G)-dimethylarginine dimethylaminohydrolase [Vulcanimicrobiaceae bacterium]
MTSASPTFQAPFVRSDAGALRGVLVVPPTAALADVRPLHGESHAIAERALEQFGVFSSRLAAHGVKVVRTEAADGTPFGTLCADGAVIFADGAFVMRPSDLRRRGEIAPLEAALARAGVPIVGRIAAPGLLDGGDVLLAGETLFIAVATPRRSEQGIRASLHGNAFGREQLAAYARSKSIAVVEVPIAAEVSRLRSVAALLDEGTVLVAAGLVDATAFAALTTLVAPRGEDFGAGVLALGNRHLLANLRFRETIPLLRKAKFVVDAIDLWEFGKLGATPSSMALALKRD